MAFVFRCLELSKRFATHDVVYPAVMMASHIMADIDEMVTDLGLDDLSHTPDKFKVFACNIILSERCIELFFGVYTVLAQYVRYP